MIDCYTWITDNGYKPRMMLEETGLPHKIIPVDLRKKAQMEPDFMKISPGHKIPAIVDHDGPGGTVTVSESGAILKYLGVLFLCLLIIAFFPAISTWLPRAMGY